MVERPLNTQERNAILQGYVSEIESVVDTEIHASKGKLQYNVIVYLDADKFNCSLQVQDKVIKDYQAVGWKNVRFEFDNSPKHEAIMSIILESN
jgi:hypothetical protein